MSPAPCRRNTRKPALSRPISLVELEEVKRTAKKKHGTAANTLRSYQGHVVRAKEWLTAILKNESGFDPFEYPRGSSVETIDRKWTRSDLVKAFDIAPSRASPWAVATFIAFKCFEENLGASTADGIHAAFKSHWDNADSEGKYRGNWNWDDEKGGSGNPTSSSVVMDVVHTVKKKHGAEGVRRHSGAMSYNYLQKIYEWSLQQCPLDFSSPVFTSLSPESKKLLHTHLGWRAFSSFSWTLWTRNFEALKLQFRHLRLHCVSNDDLQLPHWKVSLEHRKNWQNKLDKEQELRGHLYDIYPQPELPAADVDKHMAIWLEFLTLMYGRPLSPEDYIFPPISSNGLIQAKSPMSHDTIQKWINSFTMSAGINLMEANLTTHCFRRGGAQFRFMYAPIGKRWTLATIRWWGGWAEGEHRDTLIRYLLDELYYYEESHGDALKPIATEAHVSFMGEHRDMKPITFGELTTIANSLQHNITYSILSAIHTKDSTPQFYSPTCCYHGPRRVAEHNPSIPSETITITPSVAPSLINSVSTSPTKISLPPGVYVPNIDRKGIEDSNRWKILVEQWERGDPSAANGLPLKDWPEEWTKNSAIAVKYRERKLVALEFIENCGRDESVFLKQWPAAKQGIKPLHTQMLIARKAAGLARSRRSRKSQTILSAGPKNEFQ